jgi:hypothetical protein
MGSTHWNVVWLVYTIVCNYLLYLCAVRKGVPLAGTLSPGSLVRTRCFVGGVVCRVDVTTNPFLNPQPRAS